MRYTTEQIESIAAKLREMPPVEKKEHSKQEAVRMLAKEIVSLQKRGYTIEQIADALRGNGLDISTPTLKNYLQRTTQARKKKDTPPAPPRPANKGSSDASRATFTPKPDSDDI